MLKPFIHENLKCSNLLRQSKSPIQTGTAVTLVVFLHLAGDYVFIHVNQAVILYINTVYIISTLPFGHAGDVEIVQVNLLKV